MYGAVRLSLFEAYGTRFVGLDNYLQTWRNPVYRDMLGITARFVTLSLAGQAIPRQWPSRC